MIEDAEDRADGRFDQPYDVAIIGSGPAGVTLARRLGARGLKVGLFEAGGLELTAASQELYRGTEVGQPYYALDAARLRYFGGSSNHWGGWTHALEAYDFTPNPDNPLSGWPIGKSDLDPYAAEAADILDLMADRKPPDFFPPDQDRLKPLFFRFSRPTTRFGEKYRQELQASRHIEVVLNANLVDMRLDADGRTVREAVFQSYQRPEPFTVRARAFALCLGGLENPRALLNMTGDVPVGLGNEHDLVGRYFMEHLHAEIARFVIRRPLTWMLGYAPTPKLMAAAHSLNFGLRVGDFEQWNAGDFTGAMKPQPPCPFPFDKVLADAMAGDKPACPGLVGDAFIVAEQQLDPANRVRLGAGRDRFGLRQIELDWSLSQTDYRTMQTCAAEFGGQLAASNVGRLKVVDWLLAGATPTLAQLAGGNHHMGTTRMSADAKTGVVDADCRVHSLANLYIGGSSVFATSGHANPTYSIVQLALRLGDHLSGKLKG
jgi:choline dehydrogenase-like flavoprotein